MNVNTLGLSEEEFWSNSHILDIMFHNRVWSFSDDEIIERFFNYLLSDFD